MPQGDWFGTLLRGLLADIRQLVREEFALARAELRDELGKLRGVAVAFGASALGGLIGVSLLCLAIAEAISYWFNVPAWAGAAITAVLLLVAAYALFKYGRDRLAHIRALPKTTESLKETLAAVQQKGTE